MTSAPGGQIWTGRPPVEELERLLAAVVPPGPMGGPAETLYVDPERAQECIDGMKRAVLKINDAVQMTDQLVFLPPGNDPVSVNLAEQGAVMAGRARAFAVAWRAQVLATIDNLERQLSAYRENEDDIKLRLR